MVVQVVWFGVMIKLMVCFLICGVVVVIICFKEFVDKYGFDSFVCIVVQVMMMDGLEIFDVYDMCEVVGFFMVKCVVDQVYEVVGIGFEDVDVVELYDCFVYNELIIYEVLGLCGCGDVVKFVDDGDNIYGGKYVINLLGGLLFKGYFFGVIGFVQCIELVQQFCGQVDVWQVDGVWFVFQYNLGLGGVCVIMFYEKV